MDLLLWQVFGISDFLLYATSKDTTVYNQYLFIMMSCWQMTYVYWKANKRSIYLSIYLYRLQFISLINDVPSLTIKESL